MWPSALGLQGKTPTKNVERFDAISSPGGLGLHYAGTSANNLVFQLGDRSPENDSNIQISAELWRDIDGSPSKVASCHVNPADYTAFPYTAGWMTVSNQTGAEADNGSTDSHINYVLDDTKIYGAVIRMSGDGEVFWFTRAATNAQNSLDTLMKGSGMAHYAFGFSFNEA